MKTIALILSCIFFWFCGTPFTEYSVTKNTSVAGVQKSGATTLYQIKMIAKTKSSKLKFNTVWVGNENLPIKVYSFDQEGRYKRNFEKGDTIFVDAYKRMLPDENGTLKATKDSTARALPFEYDGEALVEYTYKKKTKHWKIEKIKTLPTIYYP